MKGMNRIRRGKCFRGVVAYVLSPAPHHKSIPAVTGGNLIGLSVDTVTSEFMRTQSIRPDVQKPVWHNSLRLPCGDRLTNEQWCRIADDYMKRMGFSDTHLRCYVLHDDEAGQHIHIIASRINLSDGQLYLGRNENLISTRIIQELERDWQLTQTPGPSGAETTKPKVRKPGRNETMMESRTGNKATKKVIQEAIEAIFFFYDTIDTDDFIRELQKLRITATANIASTGKMNGFSFEYAGIAFKGSQLGKAFTWANLSKRVMTVTSREPEPEKTTDLLSPSLNDQTEMPVLPAMDEPPLPAPVMTSSNSECDEDEGTRYSDFHWMQWIPYLNEILDKIREMGSTLLKPFRQSSPFTFTRVYRDNPTDTEEPRPAIMSANSRKFSR